MAFAGKVIGRKEELDTIPDLLLQATSHSGPGAFDKISYITRSERKGGNIPQTGCNNQKFNGNDKAYL